MFPIHLVWTENLDSPVYEEAIPPFERGLPLVPKSFTDLGIEPPSPSRGVGIGHWDVKIDDDDGSCDTIVQSRTIVSRWLRCLGLVPCTKPCGSRVVFPQEILSLRMDEKFLAVSSFIEKHQPSTYWWTRGKLQIGARHRKGGRRRERTIPPVCNCYEMLQSRKRFVAAGRTKESVRLFTIQRKQVRANCPKCKHLSHGGRNYSPKLRKRRSK